MKDRSFPALWLRFASCLALGQDVLGYNRSLHNPSIRQLSNSAPIRFTFCPDPAFVLGLMQPAVTCDNPGKNGASGSFRIAYRTALGRMYQGKAEDVFKSANFKRKYAGKIQLIFTSPPFPLNTKKRYGNLKGDAYLEWLASFAPTFKDLLSPDGSIVMEIGNAWEPGKPVMSPLALRALLSFLDEGKLNLCQQFVVYNPARLPSPAQWVNIERIRVKDSFTHVWWMSPSERPKADNRRVLNQYSKSMEKLLESGKYNAGRRPSQHNIGAKSFLRNNGGSIPSNVITLSNTSSSDKYLDFCRKESLALHPARMPIGLPEFFINLLTEPKDLVLDPFGGSNTTGAAAEHLKRRWLSVEPKDEYISGSLARFTSPKIGKHYDYRRAIPITC